MKNKHPLKENYERFFGDNVNEDVGYFRASKGWKSLVDEMKKHNFDYKKLSQIIGDDAKVNDALITLIQALVHTDHNPNRPTY